VTPMFSELRHSVRLLRRASSLSLAAVCTLGLAIGATAAVFSVVDKVLLQPLPIEGADRIVVIWPRDRTNAATIGEVAYASFQDWQTSVPELRNLAAVGSTTWTLILREGEAATIPVAAVSGSLFSLFGTPAASGRTLRPDDDRPGSSRVAVLSHDSWVRRFGSDPAIVGRGLRFEDAVYTIVGIMPEGFEYPHGAELWVPLVPQLVDAGARYQTDLLTEPGFGVLFVLGRLAPGVTLAAARERVSALIERGGGTAFHPGMIAALTPLDEYMFGNSRPALIALATCVVLVLLIGCANVAVLLLGRAAGRADEAATRLAIGATRLHIIRQSVVEASTLTILSAAVGLFLAYWTVAALVALAPSEVPNLGSVRIDGRTLLFTCAVTVLTALLVGLEPGVHASRWTLTHVLNGGARIVKSHRMRRGFVVLQVGLAIVLLVCAGLAGRSLTNLLRVDVGFDPTNVLTLDITLPGAPTERSNALYTALLPRVRALPGVEAAGAIFQRPLEHAGIGMDSTFVVEGQPTDVQLRAFEKNPIVNLETATPGYFHAIGMSVLMGRPFADADVMSAPRVAVIGDRLARRLWPGQDPIGKRILPPGQPGHGSTPPWATVVGTVRDGRYRGLTDPRFDLYLAYLQVVEMPVKHLMVRTSSDPLSLINAIRAETSRLEPNALVERAGAMSSVVDRATAPWRFSASTLGLLGLLALILASLGVYASLNQSVVERTREIGVRVAVGAMPREIAGLIAREGLLLTTAGIVIGLTVAAGIGRVLAGLLFEVRPVDPLTMVATAALFGSISAAATCFPAWRAARVDPASVLRRP